jgi:hypothetical protein
MPRRNPCTKRVEGSMTIDQMQRIMREQDRRRLSSHHKRDEEAEGGWHYRVIARHLEQHGAVCMQTNPPHEVKEADLVATDHHTVGCARCLGWTRRR